MTDRKSLPTKYKYQQQKRTSLIQNVRDKKFTELKTRRNKLRFEQIQGQRKQSKSKCLQCYENKPNSTLCMIGCVTFTNTFLILYGCNPHSLSFSGCGHLIHFECYRQSQIFITKEFRCPLCRVKSNILIPHPKQYQYSNQNKQKNAQIQQICSFIVQVILDKHGQLQIPRELSQFRTIQSFLDLVQGLVQVLAVRAVLNRDKCQKQINFLNGFLYFLAFYYNLVCKESGKCFSEINLLLIQKLELNLIFSYSTIFQTSSYRSKSLYIIQHAKQLLNKVFKEFIVIQNSQKRTKNVQRWKKQNLSQISLLNQSDRQTVDLIFIQNTFLAIVEGAPLNLQNQQLNCIQIKISPPSAYIFSENQTFSQFYCLPYRVIEILQLNNHQSFGCQKSHQKWLCFLCGKIICENCTNIRKHSCAAHQGTSFFISLITTKIKMLNYTVEYDRRSPYQNKYGAFWSPQQIPNEYSLNKQSQMAILRLFIDNKRFLQINDH